MAKLKNIIKQLAQTDYDYIYESLMESSAEKSAYLLKYMYEGQLSDDKIMEELRVNTNAYYTLRSRLNQKIEDHLLSQIESPRTDLLRKVANINEIIFTQKRTIVVATLKKLEKELLDYDLSNELAIVYKTLKKLHVHTDDYFSYSQLYNKQVSYMLDVDGMESKLTEYFQKYGEFLFADSSDTKLALSLLNREINNIYKKYSTQKSHRLYIYASCVSIFHRLFVEPEDDFLNDKVEPIEDIFSKMDQYFKLYEKDSSYYHLGVVLDFLRLEYYNHYRLYRKAENYYKETNESADRLLSNYELYTFPPRFLLTKIERHLRWGTERELYEENKALFQDYEPETDNVPHFTIYVAYQALSCYYVEKYSEAARWLNHLLDTVSVKPYPYVLLEVKLLLAIQYCLLGEEALLSQIINSIQRQIRQLGKETCIQAVLFTKVLRLGIQSAKADRKNKITQIFEKMQKTTPGSFNLVQYIRADEDFIQRIPV